MSYYRERFGHREGEFPVCEDVAARSIALPFFPAMTESQVAQVAPSRCAKCSGDNPRSMSRFAEPQDAAFRALNDSLSFDWRLGPYDVQQSRATPRCSPRRRSSPRRERDELHAALDQVERELGEGSFPFADGDEDIHMAIERRVTELAGRVGGKLHTARSRNDQVATDVAMFVRAHAVRPSSGPGSWPRTLVDVAETHLDWPMPGYTHLQRAQPVYLSHHLLAYCWMLIRDRDRFSSVVSATGALPLGAGALAGVNFDTDRELVARELGFASVAPRTRSTRSRTATSCSTTSRPRPPARPTCRGSEARSCCGRARSSASARSPTPGPRGPRSCPRRRTRTPPSCCAPRHRASPATWSRSTACSTASR